MADTFTDCLYGTCPACEAAGHGLWRLRADRTGKRLYCIFTDCPLSGEDFAFDEIEAMEGKGLDEIRAYVQQLIAEANATCKPDLQVDPEVEGLRRQEDAIEGAGDFSSVTVGDEAMGQMRNRL